MGRRLAPTSWDIKGLAIIGAYFGWLLVFVHEAYVIFAYLIGHSTTVDPFAELGSHPFIHIAMELTAAGLAGAVLFAGASRIRNRLMGAA
jgi:hypothetical protein